MQHALQALAHMHSQSKRAADTGLILHAEEYACESWQHIARVHH